MSQPIIRSINRHKIHILHISCTCISSNLFRLSVSQKIAFRFAVWLIFSPSILFSRNKALSYRGKRVGAWIWQLSFSTIVKNTNIFDSARLATVQLHSLVFEKWYALSDLYLFYVWLVEVHTRLTLRDKFTGSRQLHTDGLMQCRRHVGLLGRILDRIPIPLLWHDAVYLEFAHCVKGASNCAISYWHEATALPTTE